MDPRIQRRLRDLRGLAGHALDLYHFAALNMTNPRSYTKFRVIDAIRRRSGARVFVEAGTFEGVTAERCSRVFERVYTIELDPRLARQAREYLAACSNCQALEGDALRLAPEVLARPEVDHALVFLDGHFSGGPTAKGELPEPACEALNALAPFRHKIRAIVVDDFRTFGTNPGFPPKSALLRAAEDNFAADGFALNVAYDQLVLVRDD